LVRKGILPVQQRSVHQRSPVKTHLYQEGEASEAACRHCGKGVTTHFATRTYRLHESGVEVPGVLVAVCDECDAIVAIPAQSSVRLRDARVRRKDESLEARIPTHLEDVIHLIADRFQAPVQTFRPSLLRFYLREFAESVQFAERVRALGQSELAQGPARARISLRAPEPLVSKARERARLAGIATDAEMMRGILLAGKEDVLDGGDVERIIRLGGAAQAEGAARPRPKTTTGSAGREATRRR
jgi:hypothetical protein